MEPKGDVPVRVPKADFAVDLNLAGAVVAVSVECRIFVAACFNEVKA
jgi:hypothetical protein